MENEKFIKWVMDGINFPIGTNRRMRYDKYVLTEDEFLDKYFKIFPNDEFQYSIEWMSWYSSFINPAFGNDDSLKNRAGYYGGESFFKRLQFVYVEKYNKLLIDMELIKIFSFMDADNFFNYYDLTFEDWLKRCDYLVPSKVILDESNSNFKLTPGYLLKSKKGQNYLKFSLRSISYFQFIRDPQGY